jgi:modulator of FtsH protease
MVPPIAPRARGGFTAMYGSPSPLRYAGVSYAQDTGEARIAFLRKVYGLFLAGIVAAAVGAQIALYAGDTAVRVAVPGLAYAVRVPPLVAWFGQHYIIAIVLWFAAGFGLRAVQNIPAVSVSAMLGFTFYSGLFISPTLFYAGLVGQMGQAMTADPVRDAFVITTLAFTGLTAYVFTTKRDFSFLAGFLSMGIWVVIGASILGFFFHSALFQLAIASVGVLLFCGYVLYDTWRILNADTRVNPVTAAIALYLDALNLFLFVLRILMQSRRDD